MKEGITEEGYAPTSVEMRFSQAGIPVNVTLSQGVERDFSLPLATLCRWDKWMECVYLNCPPPTCLTQDPVPSV
jgi:hypothetical protein